MDLVDGGLAATTTIITSDLLRRGEGSMGD